MQLQISICCWQIVCWRNHYPINLYRARPRITGITRGRPTGYLLERGKSSRIREFLGSGGVSISSSITLRSQRVMYTPKQWVDSALTTCLTWQLYGKSGFVVANLADTAGPPTGDELLQCAHDHTLGRSGGQRRYSQGRPVGCKPKYPFKPVRRPHVRRAWRSVGIHSKLKI